jgi:hypothetical protein
VHKRCSSKRGSKKKKTKKEKERQAKEEGAEELVEEEDGFNDEATKKLLAEELKNVVEF